MTLHVSLNALTDDAKLWIASSDTLDMAATTVDGLTIPDYAFSFAGGDVSTMYEECREFVQTLLKMGSTEQSAAAGALIAVRDGFESTDLSQRDQYEGMWDFH